MYSSRFEPSNFKLEVYKMAKNITERILKFQLNVSHRRNTARKEKGRGGSSSFKLNLTDPCRT